MGLGQSAVEELELNPRFWHGRRVLLTGHTGFKGAWTALLLHSMGAAITGYALRPPTDPSTVSSFLNLRVADAEACYREWSAKGAEFLTPPIDRKEFPVSTAPENPFRYAATRATGGDRNASPASPAIGLAYAMPVLRRSVSGCSTIDARR